MVNQNYILISLLSLVTFAGIIFYTSTPQNDIISSQDFEYYVFEREIPSAVCKQRKCTQDFLLNYDGKSMNMHGLWPSGYSSDVCAQPADCHDIEYNQSLVDSDLLQWMNKEFVGLYSSSTSFRAHEYEKHGSCTLEANSMNTKQLQNYYFGKIKELDQKYDLVKALNKGGIYASDSQSYSYQEIVDALENGFSGESDYTVKIQCLTVDNKIYLGAIDLYLDLDFKLGKNLCAESKKEEQYKTGFNMCSQKNPIYYSNFDWSNISS